MELGATVCTPRTPNCPRCPLRRRCVAHERGDEERFPRRTPRRKVAAVYVAAAVVTRGERILLERRASENPLRGTWEIPAVELPGGDAARSALRDALRRRHQLDVMVGARLPARSHGIMNRALKIEPYRCRLRRGRVAHNDGLRWIALDALGDVAVSGATRKVVDALTG